LTLWISADAVRGKNWAFVASGRATIFGKTIIVSKALRTNRRSNRNRARPGVWGRAVSPQSTARLFRRLKTIAPKSQICFQFWTQSRPSAESHHNNYLAECGAGILLALIGKRDWRVGNHRLAPAQAVVCPMMGRRFTI
jgi:hypothetical protein